MSTQPNLTPPEVLSDTKMTLYHHPTTETIVFLLLFINPQINIHLPQHNNWTIKYNIKDKLKDNFRDNFNAIFKYNFEDIIREFWRILWNNIKQN